MVQCVAESLVCTCYMLVTNLLLIVTTQTVPRHGRCPLSWGGGNSPWLRSANLTQYPEEWEPKVYLMNECYFYSCRCKIFRSFWHSLDRPVVSRFSPGWIFQGLKEREAGNSLATIWLGDMRPHIAGTVDLMFEIPSKFFFRQDIYTSFICLHKVTLWLVLPSASQIYVSVAETLMIISK